MKDSQSGGIDREDIVMDVSLPIRRTAGHLIRRAHRVAAAIFTEEIDGRLSPNQFSVLLCLCQEPGLHQIDLVTRIAADRSTINDMVARLEENGMLEKRRSTVDERKIALYVTEKGVAAVAQALPGSVRAHDRVLKLVPKNLRGPFLKALECIAEKDHA
jgi:DNA-binding MarR family transcriptional regulator